MCVSALISFGRGDETSTVRGGFDSAFSLVDSGVNGRVARQDDGVIDE